MPSGRLPRALNGKFLSCKYPMDGTRNILCRQVGKIVKHRQSENGGYITIVNANGEFRSLRRDRMIDAVVSEAPQMS